MLFPELTETDRVTRLTPPSGKNQVVLDTDTYNEIDDQFALAHALLSPEHATTITNTNTVRRSKPLTSAIVNILYYTNYSLILKKVVRPARSSPEPGKPG